MQKSIFKKIISKIINRIEPYDDKELINSLRLKKIKNKVLEENEKLASAPPLIMNWPNNIEKPIVGLVKSEIDNFAYWPKFERFLLNNNIPYIFIDIQKSTFISDVKKVDIVVWRTLSTYSGQWEAKDKIEFIQNFMGKLTLPNKESLWFYEDKVRQQWLFEFYNLPSISTFISYSKKEVKDFIDRTKYPIISKDKTSSGSEGVILIKSKSKAIKMYRKIFYNGMKLYEKYAKQKDYVLFQEAVPNNGFDLRIIIVGKSYFGYYRYPQKGDFKASGSGIVEKKEIPVEVLKISKKVRDCLPKSYLLAVDFLQDKRDQKYYLIESSIFVSVETSEQLEVNDIPGRYIENNGEFNFEEGKFWLQELMMDELMKDWIKKQKEEI